MAEQAMVSFECCQAVVLHGSGWGRVNAQQHLSFFLQHHCAWVQAVGHCLELQPHHGFLRADWTSWHLVPSNAAHTHRPSRLPICNMDGLR